MTIKSLKIFAVTIKSRILFWSSIGCCGFPARQFARLAADEIWQTAPRRLLWLGGAGPSLLIDRLPQAARPTRQYGATQFHLSACGFPCDILRDSSMNTAGNQIIN